ncbi:Tad domain-containing protein [Aquidulcibacter sp.]|jgi:Flp pilus assembly protein TadG|uniref:Tad domain-containing protein n=1 Tax=Aquidulcibacter sp. TaxID=2052990 RepID=UPI0037C06FAA
MLKALLSNIRGNIATITAIALVPIAGAVAMAAELTMVSAERSHLQSIVDSAALAGATEMAIPSRDAVGIQAVAVAFASDSYSRSGSKTPVTFAANVNRYERTITVSAAGARQPMIGIPGIGATNLSVSATAESLQNIPLCVLQTNYQPPAKTAKFLARVGVGAVTGFDLFDQAKIRAGGCLIHSNERIVANDRAEIEASRVQAVTDATGQINPTANVGALEIADPFTALNLNPKSMAGCQPLKRITIGAGQTYVMPPGVHCEKIDVLSNGILQLQPGEHYFFGNLDFRDNASLLGDDVVMIFGPLYKFNFGGNTRVELSARETGPLAGFLIATHPTNYQSFTISSNNVRQLLGTIYIPRAELIISSTGSVAQESAWSVIVARAITMTNNPILVINSSYVNSGVPVPDGVGPTEATPRLKQ